MTFQVAMWLSLFLAVYFSGAGNPLVQKSPGAVLIVMPINSDAISWRTFTFHA